MCPSHSRKRSLYEADDAAPTSELEGSSKKHKAEFTAAINGSFPGVAELQTNLDLKGEVVKDDSGESSSSSSSSSGSSSSSYDSSDEESGGPPDDVEHSEGVSDDEEYSSTSSSSSSSSEDEARVSSPVPPPPPIATLSRLRKPPITTAPGNESRLLSRLSSFLSSMAAANDALEEDRLAGRLEEKQLENVQEGESHIEMDLGLGVLEAKADNSSTSSSSESSDEETRLNRLRGEKKRAHASITKPAIEELGEGLDPTHSTSSF